MGVICGSAFAGGAAEAKKAAKIPSTVTLAAMPGVVAMNLGIFDPLGACTRGLTTRTPSRGSSVPLNPPNISEGKYQFYLESGLYLQIISLLDEDKEGRNQVIFCCNTIPMEPLFF
jgi:hypothetical protein